MKRLSTFGVMVGLLLVALLVPGASAKNADFISPMSHAQETGEVNAPGAHGFAEYRVDGTTLHYRLTVRHLTGPALMAHIHTPGERHIDAPIDIWLCGTASFPGPGGTPACNPTTDGLLVEGSVSVTLAQLDRLEAGIGYTNVHTAAHLPGEVRGQVLSVGS